MTTDTASYLVVSVIGPDQDTTTYQLTKHIVACGGNILNMRMTSLENEFGVILLISGNWSAIAKIEASLPALENKLHISTQVRRTTPKEPQKKSVPYLVHAITNDRQGILNDLTKFFTKQDVKIDDIHAHTYLANSGVTMSAFTVNIQIPLATHLATFREHFLMYCDSLNIDAGIEPKRD